MTARFALVAQRVHLQERIRAVEIRRGRIDGRTRLLAFLDQPLQLQVHEAVHVAASPDRRDTTGEIQTDETLTELAVHLRPGRVIQVLVHHHETWDHRLAGQVDDGGARGRFDAGRVANGGDVSPFDDERLAFARRGTRAVDDPSIGQRDHRRIDLGKPEHRTGDRRVIGAGRTSLPSLCSGHGGCSHAGYHGAGGEANNMLRELTHRRTIR